VFDKATRQRMPVGMLLARCGVKPKRAASARKARARKAHVAAVCGGEKPGRIFDAGDALYMIGGDNGMDEALLRKRLGRLANLVMGRKGASPEGDDESAVQYDNIARDEAPSGAGAGHAGAP